jgi:hypothetical protein
MPAALEPTSSAVSSADLAMCPTASSGRAYSREWLYRLVMFPSYFTPCHGCCNGNKTPKREQLLTLFDTGCPSRVYCSHCPEHKARGPWLLQVRAGQGRGACGACGGCMHGARRRRRRPDRARSRPHGTTPRPMRPTYGARHGAPHAADPPPKALRRARPHRRARPGIPHHPHWPRSPPPQVRRSAFKDVVKATDIARLGCDTSGVQQYTLNGSKVLYLNREATPERKGTPTAAAPATCSVDGRAMMDKNSQYCSLKCKMHGEDPEFTEWLDAQDPSVKAAAYAAAIAPPRPTAACKRAAPNGCPYSFGTSGGSSGDGSGAPSPTSSGASGAAAGGVSGGSSARSRKAPRTAVSEASGPGSAATAMPAPAPKAPAVPRLTLKTAASAPASASLVADRAAAAAAHQSAFLSAATDGPVLGGGWMAAGPLAGLEGAVSCTTAAWGAPAPADWAAPCDAVGGAPADDGAAAAAEWWLPAAGAAPAAVSCLDDHDAGLLVEWPAGGAPLGSSASELLRYGSGAASPGSDAPIDSVFCWDC